MTDVAPTGRRFTGRRKVRLGDVTASGRLRLDALTRYTQDVSDDDTTDAGLAPEPAWVVRRTTVTVAQEARLGEELAFTTYCSALGRRWADRTLDIRGSEGALYQVVTLWICVDPISGRPCELTEQFLAIYGEAAQGRTVSARLINPKLGAAGSAPGDAATPAEAGRGSWPWPLRAVDFDTLGHVNNAAYWAVAEESLEAAPLAGDSSSGVDGADDGSVSGPLVARAEYGTGLDPADRVTVHEAEVGSARVLWLVTTDGATAATISLDPNG